MRVAIARHIGGASPAVELRAAAGITHRTTQAVARRMNWLTIGQSPAALTDRGPAGALTAIDVARDAAGA